MARSKAAKLADVHEAALIEFDRVQAACREVREQCLAARRFYSIPGAQWEGSLGLQFENKPMMELNKVHLAVIRIINEYRNNRVEVTFSPKDGDKDETADACNGIYRADARDSGAMEARGNAFEEAVGGGIGAWRLRSCYEDEIDGEEDDDAADEDRKQRIVWEPIVDADSCVFFDLDAKRQDKRDAKRCWVLTSMTRESYEAEYGDDPASWPQSLTTGRTFDWAPANLIYVAEYYEVTSKKQEYQCWVGLDGGEVEYTTEEIEEEAEPPEDGQPAEPSLREELEATGFTLKKKKNKKVRKVRKYIMSGGKVLEDCGFVPGKYIPIIVTYGKRWYVDGVERCMGHVQLAMDAQRLKNMLISKLADISARSSVQKPVVSPEQIAGFSQMWADDNTKDYPYLLLNSTKDVDGNPMSVAMQYTQNANVPPALAALLQLTEEDLKDLLGNQQAGEEMNPNISGKVVELVQNRLDMQTYIYMDNHKMAVEYEGVVWMHMANDIYAEPNRKMKMLTEDDTVSSTVINTNGYDDERGMYAKNDMTRARFDVSGDVGPTSSSKRASTVRTLMGVMQITGAVDPETTQLLSNAILMNVEGEGLQDLRDYSRQKLVRIGAIKPTKEEQTKMAEEQANQKPDPNAEFLMAEADKSQALAQKAQADTGLAIANTEKAHADAAATLASIPQGQAAAAIEAARAINELSQPPAPAASA